MTLNSLPVLDVWIAFNPTEGGASLTNANQQALPASGSSNSYWTWIGSYVRDFATKSGKQHYLDRVEATTLRMTLNNRTGFFTNGSVNGTSYTIAPRMPIAVQATWNSTTYPTFFGIISSVTEKLADALNSDLDIEASDLLQYLSLKYLHRPSFWEGFATSTSTASWYRCSNYALATVTSAVANGTSITYQIVDSSVNFTTGQNVTVTGLSGNTLLNVTNVTITGTTVSGGIVTAFTVASSLPNGTAATSSGVAYITTLHDYVGSSPGYFLGQVSYPDNGVLIYDTDGCVSLSGTSNVATGSLQFDPAGGPDYGGIDFWILGQQVQGNTLLQIDYGSPVNYITLGINTQGFIQVKYSNGTPTVVGSQVNDGYWHHVGLATLGSGSSGTLYLYCDGVFTSLGLTSTYLYASGNIYLGADSTLTASYNGQIDEVVVSNLSSISTLAEEIQQRYRAGIILQLGYPVTKNKVYSADRIAEMLTLAGFGSITGGSVSAQSSLNVPNFRIWTSYGTYANYAYNTGQGTIATEPYYWDSPISSSTALDLIQQVTDTDIGSFYQDPSGVFYFAPQNYFGTWTFSPAVPPYTPSGTWAPNSVFNSPYSSLAVLADDNTTGAYIYDWESLEVVYDDVDTWTTVRITPQAGVDQIYENLSNEQRWGFSTLSKTSTLSSSLTDALSTAYFLGYIYQSPLPRVNSVMFLSETVSGGTVGYNLPLMLAVQQGAVFLFKRTMPNAQANFVKLPMAVESVSHEFAAEPGHWHTTLTLDPYPVRAGGSN